MQRPPIYKKDDTSSMFSKRCITLAGVVIRRALDCPGTQEFVTLQNKIVILVSVT